MVENLNLDVGTDRSLFPSNFTIRAIRDSRYHNSAYAIAELIDNAVEADAAQIQLLCREELRRIKSQTRARLVELAVLDNGSGMDPNTLLHALRFGVGTRHDKTTGIGKYGMGLPTSSMSQCKRVDVWTWQRGIDAAWHSWIDADEIAGGNHEVPIPDQAPIPDIWRQVGYDKIFGGKSGTLIVWSKLDKIQWKTGKALIGNTEREIGRIHRQFISADFVRINAISFLSNKPDEPIFSLQVRPNDPMYLMVRSSVPEERWANEPMFHQWGDIKEYSVEMAGKKETIFVKYSIVKQEALAVLGVAQNPGSTPRGVHARQNIGVSVVREDREIILEDAFLREGGSADNPQNRWWGCEVLFFKGCDELFGVDHNKQMVANFTQAAKTLARDDRPIPRVLEDLGIDEDEAIFQIVGDIRNQTRAMMQEIGAMFSRTREKARAKVSTNPENKATRTATDADQEAIERGSEAPTKTDEERQEHSVEERMEGITKELVESGRGSEEAHELATMLISEGLSYQFLSRQLDGYQMFSVRPVEGVLHIYLNTDHPIYDLLRHVEDELPDDAEENDPAYQSIVAIRLLLSSWARMEDHTESREARLQIQEIGRDWGKQVAKVLSHLRERTV